MKKLVIMATVAMLGVAANAMAVDWKYTGAKADAGSTVYVILGSTASSTLTSLAAIQSAAISSATITKSATKYIAYDTANSDSLSKTSGNIYYVIVDKDEKSYAISSIVDASGSVYDIENKETSPGQFTDITSGSIGAPSNFSGGVPEPTSAMLMLLGVAGLALKRKGA